MRLFLGYTDKLCLLLSTNLGATLIALRLQLSPVNLHAAKDPWHLIKAWRDGAEDKPGRANPITEVSPENSFSIPIAPTHPHPRSTHSNLPSASCKFYMFSDHRLAFPLTPHQIPAYCWYLALIYGFTPLPYTNDRFPYRYILKFRNNRFYKQ